MARIRTFIAIDLGKAIRDKVVVLQETLARSGTEVKWVGPENIHVTLLFLGEVEDRNVPAVCRIVTQESKNQPPFPLTVEGVGCFPNPRRPRIVWVGVGEGAQPLCRLHNALETPLQELGYRREERKYTPHITLGRVRKEGQGDRLAATLAKYAGWRAGETMVQEVLVMSSELTREGPLYTVMGRGPIGSG